MDVLAKPWTGLVFVALESGALRFSELRDAVGSIGDRMLSVRLRELEEKLLVRREVIAGPPVRVEYVLTAAGRGFREVSDAARRWGAVILLARAPRAPVTIGATIGRETVAVPKKRPGARANTRRPKGASSRRV